MLFAAGELYALVGLEADRGSLAGARGYLLEAIALAEDLGAEMFLYFFRSDLAVLLMAEGDYDPAAPLLRSSLLLARRIGLRQELAGLLFGAACLAPHRRDLLQAARLHGAADVAIAGGLAGGNINWTEMEQGVRDEDQPRLRAAMPSEDFERAYEFGAGLTPQQAVELALGRKVLGA
ncbi:MAG: hypothetical protein ABSE47_08550 [Acidimicrobiales bacterium]